MKLDETNDDVVRNSSSAPAEDRPAEYLEREAGLAYGDILERLQMISDRLKPSAVVAKAVRRHPWRTTALASALGFCVGAVLTGRRRRTTATTAAQSPAASLATPPISEAAVRTPLWISLVGPTLEVARVFAERWAVNALTEKHQSSDRPPPDA